MIDSLHKRSSGLFFALGALAIILGVATLAWPGMTLLSLVIMWGAYALVDGVSTLVGAFSTKEGRGLGILSGALGILAGIACMFSPVVGAVTFGWILGFWVVVRGILEIAAAFSIKEGSAKALLIIGGIFWIIAGGLMLANPGEAMLGMTVFFGFMAIAWGVMFIVTGFTVRKAAKSAASA